MKFRKYILPLLAIVVMTSCNSYTKVLKSASYDQKYEMAKQYYSRGQFNRASMLLNDVIQVLKGTDRGEESLYLLGMSNLNSRDYNAAAQFFNKYYTSYPKGIYTEEARYYSGMSYYKSTPEPKLDQSQTLVAIREFQEFIDQYPNSRFRQDAQQKIFELQDKLVEKEYLNAKLYYDLGTYFMNCYTGNNFQACIVTSENAIREYPYTPRREDFSYLILKSKFELAQQSVESKKKERYLNAVDEYYNFKTEFPESKRLKEAQSLYNKAVKLGYVKSSDEENQE
ncbi:outer membrane protein assembly factor BamD [Pseudoprevotella muciniphila]|uniref:Outer membrane protein assembly factor BamD n=1 Tax=Pseudoprevotella muciniphila TaxID=2133944 RepID=A0A5P8E9E2_9BACT|nr:outer membrane protein assembly factor BamD [Pseudoprevotella muciniphila]QFQ13655.1 outer membrane protein assembly factor BamD [Pseudoprevotella muciniphila]